MDVNIVPPCDKIDECELLAQIQDCVYYFFTDHIVRSGYFRYSIIYIIYTRILCIAVSSFMNSQEISSVSRS